MAVGRYQHAHAASTYSYTLALSRSPSPSSLPYSFLQPSYPLVLSPPHLPFLPFSHMSPVFFPFAPIIILPFVSLALPFFLFVIPFFSLFLKTLFTFFPLLLFSLSISAFLSFIIENLSFPLISYCRFSLHVLSLSLWIYTG